MCEYVYIRERKRRGSTDILQREDMWFRKRKRKSRNQGYWRILQLLVETLSCITMVKKNQHMLAGFTKQT